MGPGAVTALLRGVPWSGKGVEMAKKPWVLSVAQSLYAASALGCLLAAGGMGVGVAFCHDSSDPHCVAKGWALIACVLVLSAYSMYAAVGLGARGRVLRVAWWVGIVVALAIAVGGAAIVSSPVRTHQTDLLPELFWGLAVLGLAGVMLAVLLVPAARRWVKNPSLPPGRAVGSRPGQASGGDMLTPLRAELERLRRVAWERGERMRVISVSGTEATVETSLGRLRVKVGDDGQAKVEPLP